MPEEIPGWVDDTPYPTTYDLSMFDTGGSAIQEIQLTRDEFIALKAHLAEMRGYGHQSDLTAYLKDPSFGYGDQQQGAFQLQTAREVFQKYPALVMAKEMPTGFEELCEVKSRSSLAHQCDKGTGW